MSHIARPRCRVQGCRKRALESGWCVDCWRGMLRKEGYTFKMLPRRTKAGR